MKILIVEDNRKLASLLQRALQEENHIVDTAEDGDQAIGQAMSIDYDLMILDWMLPGADGIAVCRALRDRGWATPILMLTAHTEVSRRVLGLDSGADDCLQKPFDLGELLARVRALGRRGTSYVRRNTSGPVDVEPA